MPFRRAYAGVAVILVALGLGAVGVELLAAAPASAAVTEPVRRVLILSLPNVVWRDLDAPDLPNLSELLDTAAVANLSTRAPSLDADLASGYATLGSGDKAVSTASDDDGAAYDASERIGAETAGDVFARRSGERVNGGLVHLGVAGLTAANQASPWRAHLGALGDALAAAGYTRAVIGNADGSELQVGAPARRESVAALMGANGTEPGGTVSRGLLGADVTAPFGVRLEPAAVTSAFDAAWTDHSVVLVEASDLLRASGYSSAQTPDERAATLHRALVASDEIVGQLLQRVNSARDAVLVVGPVRKTGDAALMVAALRAPGLEPGLLRSGTTQRAGYVQLMDVAPTVLDLVGVAQPDSMRGRPFAVTHSATTAAERRATLVDGTDAARFRAQTLVPVAVAFMLLQLLVAVVAVIAHTGRAPRSQALLPPLALGTLGYVLAVYLARLVPFHELGAPLYWVFLVGFSVAFGVTVWFGARRHVVDAFIVALGAAVALLVVDVVLGSTLQLDSAFGFSPEIAGRFIGFGNVSYAVLAAAAILLAGLLAHRLGRRWGPWVGVAVLVVVIVADGAPFWGADVGGMLTMVPVFALLAARLLGRPLRARTVLLAAGATVAGVVVVTGVDLLRPAGTRTHLARLVEQVDREGLSALTTVVHRKLDMSLSTLTTSHWLPLVVLGIGFVAYLARRPTRPLRALVTRIPELRAALVGLLMIGVLGAALNDQGVVVPAVMLGVLVPVLAGLTSARLRTVRLAPARLT